MALLTGMNGPLPFKKVSPTEEQPGPLHTHQSGTSRVRVRVTAIEYERDSLRSLLAAPPTPAYAPGAPCCLLSQELLLCLPGLLPAGSSVVHPPTDPHSTSAAHPFIQKMSGAVLGSVSASPNT